MFRKLLRLGLAALLTQAAFARPAAAATKAEEAARFAERVKTGIAKLGTGPQARVEVKLRDKRKLEGYVGEAWEDGFTVIEAKSGAATKVAYPQVRQVKGHNLSTGASIAVFAGLMTLIFVLVYVTALSSS